MMKGREKRERWWWLWKQWLEVVVWRWLRNKEVGNVLFLENLRNRFLYVMVELGNCWKAYILGQIFQFQVVKLFLIKLNLRFYLIETSFSLLMHLIQRVWASETWMGLRSAAAVLTSKVKNRRTQRGNETRILINEPSQPASQTIPSFNAQGIPLSPDSNRNRSVNCIPDALVLAWSVNLLCCLCFPHRFALPSLLIHLQGLSSFPTLSTKLRTFNASSSIKYPDCNRM